MDRDRKPKKPLAPGDKPGRALADSGRSGRGSESVRPFLRAQLKLQQLMQTQFPPPGEGLEVKDVEEE